EAVGYRRYRRMIEEEEKLPDLIVTDGGKGQFGAALQRLYLLGSRGQVSIIDIAKRLEDISHPGDPIPMYLDIKPEMLRLIQHIRNEAHRFGITFHRNKRSKNAIQSTLTKIPGIGDKTMEKLMLEFKSVKRLSEAQEDAIVKIIGKSKA